MDLAVRVEREFNLDFDLSNRWSCRRDNIGEGQQLLWLKQHPYIECIGLRDPVTARFDQRSHFGV